MICMVFYNRLGDGIGLVSTCYTAACLGIGRGRTSGAVLLRMLAMTVYYILILLRKRGGFGISPRTFHAGRHATPC